MENPSTSPAHTAGTWNFRKHTDGHFSILGMVPADDVDAIGAPIECRLADVFTYEANARLIAAAPDLLEVCKMLLNDENMDDMTAVKLLTEVIAKAEG